MSALSVPALRDLTVAARPTPEIDLTIARSLLVGTGLVVWLSVALFKAFALCIELLALRGVKRRAKPLDRATLATLRVWNANAGALRKASIAISSDVDVPCAAGLWAPAILLPRHVVANQGADDIDRIVMHESAHLARYDDWTNVLERALGAVLWFNPALAFARRRIAIDREIACDDWVVARMGGAHGYASCLAAHRTSSLVAEIARTSRRTPVACDTRHRRDRRNDRPSDASTRDRDRSRPGGSGSGSGGRSDCADRTDGAGQ